MSNSNRSWILLGAMRAVLFGAILLAGADIATRLAFTATAIEARVETAVRAVPTLAARN